MVLLSLADTRLALVNNGPKFGKRCSVDPVDMSRHLWHVSPPFQVCFRKASMASPLENDEEGVSLEARYLMIYCS